MHSLAGTLIRFATTEILISISDTGKINLLKKQLSEFFYLFKQKAIQLQK
jgi:hypothetical protein